MSSSGLSAWIPDEWARQLTRALESMTGEELGVIFTARELTPAEINPENGNLFWWEQRFSISPESLVWMGASTSSSTEIGNRVLRSAGIEDADQENIRSTYLEILNQALSGLAGALSNLIGREVSCGEGQPVAPHAPVDGVAGECEIRFPDLTLSVVAVFSSTLSNLSREETDPAKPPPLPDLPSEVSSQPNKSIDLLLDVELPVSISFGRAQLPLKDVIKLTTGSIVELNRALAEPVEVIVNNCVIARGEVVVVEGNYGIRIKQVVSRQERLRTLT